jgi:predicted Zn-dependent protease
VKGPALGLAWSYHARGLHDLAIDELKRGLAMTPADAMAHALLASCLLAKGRVHAAEYEVGEALRLDPGSTFASLTLARVLTLRNRWSEALRLCSEVLAADPSDADAHLLRAEVFLLSGDRPAALASLRAAAKLRPDDIAVMRGFADYYLRVGDLAQAEHFALAVLAQHAEDADGHLLMARVCLLRDEVDHAERHVATAIADDPDSHEALRAFADVKTRRSPLLGVWWRWNAWMQRLGTRGMVSVLIGAYIVFNLTALVVEDLGYRGASSVIRYLWLALAVYSWVAIPLYQRRLKAELAKFRFDLKF